MQQASGSTAQMQEGLNMSPGRSRVNLRRNRRGAGKPLGGDSVPVPLKRDRGDVQALRQRGDAAIGLPPHEFAELEKGAQENAAQHPDACSARIFSPHRLDAARGIAVAVLLSLPIWALLIWWAL